MSQIKLSIVIPVYNAGGYIERCLGSIINGLDMYTLGNVEIIAVDDGSDDSSYNILLQYKNIIPSLMVLRQSNKGAAGARATGADYAAGDYIWFIDPDDFVPPDAVSFILEITESTEKAGDADSTADGAHTEPVDIFIFDACEVRNGKNRLWEHFKDARVFTNPEQIKMLQRGVLYSQEIGSKTPFAAPWDKIYRREFLSDNEIVFRKDLRVLDDMFFNMEAFGAANRVEYIKHPIYNYVRNDAGITASYTPGRAKKDIVVWKAIERYIVCLRTKSRYGNRTYGAENRLGKEYSIEDIRKLENAFHKRVLKSFGICCKLDIFNRKRHTSINKRIAYAAKLARYEHYRDAFNVSFCEIEPLLWPFLLFGKLLNHDKEEANPLYHN